MKKTLYLLILFLPFQLLAQTSSIEGAIIDKSSERPIEFASVSVYKSVDSSLVNGMLTANNGSFLVKTLKSEQFYLKIQFLGYDTKIIPSINLVGGKMNLGNIELSPDQRFLNEVKVTGQQTQSFNKINKQV